MYAFPALFCLLAVANAKPLQSHVEPASHIVIVTPQAQVHLEPALRYVHGLSPLARVAAPHHEETIVYVPAGAATSVVPVVDAVGSGRASSGAAIASENKQFDEATQNIQQAQQQIQQSISEGAQNWGEAGSSTAAAVGSAGSQFFPSLFPPNYKKEEQKLNKDKIELIETPANTQPLLTATEARHFYSLPQVYHTPVVDVVHTPVYLAPISAIRARSIQPEQALELKAEQEQPQPQAAEPQPQAQSQPQAILLKEIKPEQEQQPEQPLEPKAEQAEQQPQPQLKQQPQQQLAEQPQAQAQPQQQQQQQQEPLQQLKQQPAIEIEKEPIKEPIKEEIKEAKPQAAEELIKTIPAEPLPEKQAEKQEEKAAESIPQLPLAQA